MATVFFFSFLLLATCRGETMVEKQWWRRERERDRERERERERERVKRQTFLGLEICLDCIK